MTKDEAIERVKKLIIVVIDYLEGGYFHPDMIPQKPEMFGKGTNDELYNAYLRSDETMYGLDRTNGGSLNTGANGKQFWAIVDKYYTPYHANINYWNDKADGKRISANVGKQLKALLTEIIYNQFSALMHGNFTDTQIAQLLTGDPELLFNVLYLTWNGSGNFQTVAQLLKKNWSKTDKQKNELIQNWRKNKNSTFANGAAKIEKIYKTDDFKKAAGTSDSSNLWWLLGVAVIGGAILLNRK